MYLHPIADIQTNTIYGFSQDTCNYTTQGREVVYRKLKSYIATEIHKLMKNIYEYNSVELADNKLSKYSSQKGNCLITGNFLYANEVEIHHVKPISLGGTDSFANLIAIHKDIHKLIHSTTNETIDRYMDKLQLNEQELGKVNKYRKECN
ncbi:HNH endonuclease [Dethiothermospora halolimnae]|uniref:HNH endonuclease n=1 Tax=Dethiothermospora halolimnae TaxID=3114390 RepID=UPI003CCBB1B3